ncbi:hypothetical protein D2T29_12310 [Sinirhodobacter populi]|uniref:Uncharacterized protein n=1 Tax=Paenirhodobacter populi TaxID=2306993 RepID=A0A443KCD5_9RHOB|nr:hypothetical protein [Sinirhodobacter populi]RWR30448.1 hypothetical protein D2T29_12310 [Sinirhodobacter populi]
MPDETGASSPILEIVLQDYRADELPTFTRSMTLFVQHAPQRLDITTSDGRLVWIEVEGDDLRVHAFAHGEDEPTNIRITPFGAVTEPN